MTGRDDMAAPAAWATTLENVLAQQSAVLSDLGEWADRQRLCIADGQVDELLMVLGHRQVLVERLLDTQSELSGLTDGLEDRLQTVEPEIRHRLRSRMRDVDDALQRVLEQDDQDHEDRQNNVQNSDEELHGFPFRFQRGRLQQSCPLPVMLHRPVPRRYRVG